MQPRPCLGLAFILSAVLSFPACISTTFRPSAHPTALPSPPVEVSSVRVLARPPSGPFVRLGEIEALVTGYYSYEKVLQRVRTTAAAEGANAIVFVRDVSTLAAASDTDPDSAWRKRYALVYDAVRLPDPPRP